jgi:hypothetical protein
MATTNTNTQTAPTTGIPQPVQKIGEQLVAAVQQGQQLSVDAAKKWVKAVSVLPIPDLPKVPGIPAVPGVEAVTTYTFGVATDLLSAQRDFALQLAKVFVPAQSA